ncbi:ABC transporter permease subunit [Thermosphaera chiliense]|uniref:ABC transporter permease subunit n=1 Tax=Thermosphaera chiliense TaxID=3402707 RepID=A0A7M1UUR5_9CREN|nr:ABC transporter permease subunit [Thermosphaera aggregans]QOR94834.1 ABC transporter permease subunit [Thermosphaera aggregans]
MSDVNPIFYDFKRAFIRPATLVTLAVFILVGVGLSYLVSISLSMGAGSSYPAFLAKLDVETGELTMHYNIYDSEMRRTTANVEVNLLVEENGVYQTLKTFAFRADGYHVVETTLESDIIRSLPEDTGRLLFEVRSSTPFGFNSIVARFIKGGGGVLYASTPLIYFSSLDGTKSVYSAGYVFLKNDELTISMLIEPPGDGFELYCTFSTDTGNAGLEKALLAGNVSTGLNVFKTNASELGLNASTTTGIMLYLKNPEGLTYLSGALPVIRIQTGIIQRRITNIALGTAGLGLFSQFFPIVVLYLAYTLVAKPKGIGALEFLIARPVTRLEVYVTRFTAGVLTALASTGVFFAAFNASIFLLTGYSIEASYTVILFLGVAGSLIAFYSVCYMLSTVASGGKYLAVSIILYLFFTMIMGILVFILAYFMHGFTPRLVEELQKLQYTSYYFNPLGLTSFATYFVNRAEFPDIYAEVSVVNPYLVVAAGAAWTLVPFLLGWTLFRKANLSR